MISMSELRRVSARLGLGLAQAEHEYALLCALDGLAQTASLSETFCLKGGTALRQLYFPDWRHSVDLDFFVLPTFAESSLPEGLERTISVNRLSADQDSSLPGPVPPTTQLIVSGPLCASAAQPPVILRAEGSRYSVQKQTSKDLSGCPDAKHVGAQYLLQPADLLRVILYLIPLLARIVGSEEHVLV